MGTFWSRFQLKTFHLFHLSIFLNLWQIDTLFWIIISFIISKLYYSYLDFVWFDSFCNQIVSITSHPHFHHRRLSHRPHSSPHCQPQSWPNEGIQWLWAWNIDERHSYWISWALNQTQIEQTLIDRNFWTNNHQSPPPKKGFQRNSNDGSLQKHTIRLFWDENSVQM